MKPFSEDDWIPIGPQFVNPWNLGLPKQSNSALPNVQSKVPVQHPWSARQCSCWEATKWSNVGLEAWKIQNLYIHPRKLTWIPKMMVWKWWFLLKMAIFGIHVRFRWCNFTLHTFVSTVLGKSFFTNLDVCLKGTFFPCGGFRWCDALQFGLDI